MLFFQFFLFNFFKSKIVFVMWFTTGFFASCTKQRLQMHFKNIFRLLTWIFLNVQMQTEILYNWHLFLGRMGSKKGINTINISLFLLLTYFLSFFFINSAFDFLQAKKKCFQITFVCFCFFFNGISTFVGYPCGWIVILDLKKSCYFWCYWFISIPITGWK